MSTDGACLLYTSVLAPVQYMPGVYRKPQCVAGVKAYVMSYRAEIEFVEDCMWGGTFAGINGAFSAVRGRPKNALDAFNPNYVGKQHVSRGQRTHVTGEMGFMKTEQGWRLTD